MERPKCSVREMIQMIEEQMERPVHLEIQPSADFGWKPLVITSPRHAAQAQMQADAIADGLRKRFELVWPHGASEPR